MRPQNIVTHEAPPWDDADRTSVSVRKGQRWRTFCVCAGARLTVQPTRNHLEAPMKAHSYLAFLTLFCMAMTIITGYEMGKD